MKLGFTKKCLSALSVFWLMSCINTSYSRLDEIEVTGVEVDLIVGQFAHHGDAFYQHELKRTEKILRENPRDFVARNDLASAFIKLKKHQQAEQEFQLNEQHHPKRYETAANLGVLYKKMGKYAMAAKNIRRSLEIKPEGHMGLGDYYLRMIEWLEKVEQDPDYSNNFLGIPYTDPPTSIRVNKVVNKEYLLTLIKNDYQFADVYMVLGDVFLSERDYQLAIRCYYRAKRLNHPREDLCSLRINEAQDTLASMQTDGQIADFGSVSIQMDREFDAAEQWLRDYQVIEASRLKRGEPVDFKSMKDAVATLGLEKPSIIEALLYNAEEVGGAWYKREAMFFVVAMAAIVLTVIIYFLCKMSSKNSATRPY